MLKGQELCALNMGAFSIPLGLTGSSNLNPVTREILPKAGYRVEAHSTCSMNSYFTYKGTSADGGSKDALFRFKAIGISRLLEGLTFPMSLFGGSLHNCNLRMGVLLM